MNVHLHSLKLICKQSEEVIVFSDQITFIHGVLSLGKSTVARLVDFCLGGDLERTTAIQREFLAAQLSLTIGLYEVLIERAQGESTVRVTWSMNQETRNVSIRAKGEGAPVFGDVVNLSDLIFFLLDMPIVKVRRRTDDESSPLVRLSFRDLLKFCYLEQEELDSSFFRLATPILQEKSKDALNFFMGYFSANLSSLEARLDLLRTEQRSKREAALRIQTFLGRFGFASVADIELELADLSEKAEPLQALLRGDRAQFVSATHFADDQRDRLRALSDRLEQEKQALADIRGRISEQQELRSELYSMKFRAARVGVARQVLERSQFDHCPNCGQSVSVDRPRPADTCYVCLQPQHPATSQLDVGAMDADLDARIADLDAALGRHARAAERQVDILNGVNNEKQRLDRELSELLSDYETDRLARTRDAERQLAELQERSRFLERVRAMPDAVWAMQNEADALASDIEKIRREIEEEQRRLSHADENFATLEANFLAALQAVKVPGVSARDQVSINRRTLIPEVWPGGRQSEAYTFFSAGSGGKKTLFTICFALALHQTAATRKLPVPTLLMIDTPLKNITPDVNPALVEAFYRYLYEVAEHELRHQVIIIDQSLVKPSPESDLAFSSRLMTLDDPEHPPLISYYRGP